MRAAKLLDGEEIQKAKARGNVYSAQGWATKHEKAAHEIKNLAELKRHLCVMANEEERASLVACVECESPCTYGMRYLELTGLRELRKLTCGGECETCKAGCNLRSVILHKRQTSVNKLLRVALARVDR